MANSDQQRQQQKVMWGAAAQGWERHDAWFERTSVALSERICDAAGVKTGARVLDLACGAGQPMATAAARVGPTGHVLATDLAPEMVAVARRKAARLGLSHVEVQVMDAERLEVDSASFDAVTCRFGLMFCPDPSHASSEIHRVLKPGGRFAVAVWDEAAKNPFFTTMAQVLAKFVPTPPPDPGAPGVFRLAPAPVLESALRAGGFEDVTVETVALTLAYASPEEYWQVQTDLAAPLKAAIDAMPADDRPALKAAVIDAIAPFVAGGEVSFPCSVLLASGTR